MNHEQADPLEEAALTLFESGRLEECLKVIEVASSAELSPTLWGLGTIAHAQLNHLQIARSRFELFVLSVSRRDPTGDIYRDLVDLVVAALNDQLDYSGLRDDASHFVPHLSPPREKFNERN